MSDIRISTRTSGRKRIQPGNAFLLLLFSLVFLLSGCRSMNPLPNFGVGKVSQEETRIRKLMKWHSGRVEVYREFRTVFTARAVYLSEDILKSVVEFESRSKLMSPDERRDLEERLKGKDGFKLLVGFYTPDAELNDLGADGAAWIPFIEDSDGSVTRAACSDVEKGESEIYMRFLEWDLSWSRLNMLCFPGDPGIHESQDGQINLVISGSQGRGEIMLKTTPPDPLP